MTTNRANVYKTDPFEDEEIDLGTNVKTGQPVSLSLEWLKTHLHLIGPPGAGKTRLLLYIFQQLCELGRATVILINPKGALGRMARDWAISAGFTKRLRIFDTSDPALPIGFNPLAPNSYTPARHAKAVREAIRAGHGQADFDQTPQLARFLYLSLCAARELGLDLSAAVRLLRAGSAFRKKILPNLKDEFVRESLADLDKRADTRQDFLVASSLARLEALVADPFLCHIFTHPVSLDLSDIVENNPILILNVEQYRPLALDDVKIVLRLLVNAILAQVFTTGSSSSPVVLLGDECQVFMTQDLGSILDQGRELGLHAILAHQRCNQLIGEDPSGSLFDALMGCARTKIIFGGCSVSDLETHLVKEVTIDQFDPMKIKDELTSLELHPVETTRLVPTHTHQNSDTVSDAVTNSEAHGTHDVKGKAYQIGIGAIQGASEVEGSGDSSGQSLPGPSYGTGETLLPDGQLITTTHEAAPAPVDFTGANTFRAKGKNNAKSLQASFSQQEAHGDSDVIGQARIHGKAHTEGDTTGQSVVPFYQYEEHRNVSSRTFESEQEFLTTALQALKAQPKAHCFVKVPDKPGVFVRLPLIDEPWISDRQRSQALKRIHSQIEPLQLPQETLTPLKEDQEDDYE